MGWTFDNSWQKPADVKKSLKKDFNLIITCSYGNLYFFGLIESGGVRSIQGFQLAYDRGGTRTSCWGYKDIHEDMGPYMIGCSDRLLKAASPTSNPEALKFRAKCSAVNERKKRFKNLKVGDVVKLNSASTPEVKIIQIHGKIVGVYKDKRYRIRARNLT